MVEPSSPLAMDSPREVAACVVSSIEGITSSPLIVVSLCFIWLIGET